MRQPRIPIFSVILFIDWYKSEKPLLLNNHFGSSIFLMNNSHSPSSSGISPAERLFLKLTGEMGYRSSAMPDKALKNLLKMLCARGYDKDIEVVLLNILPDCPSEDRKQEVEQQMTAILVRRSAASCTARSPAVAILPVCDQTGMDGKLGIDSARIFDKLQLPSFSDSAQPIPTPLNHFLLIHGNGNVTPMAMQKIAAYNRHEPGLYIEMFQIKALMFNPAERNRIDLLKSNSSTLGKNTLIMSPPPTSYAVMAFSDAQRTYYDWPEGTLLRCWRQRGSLCQDYIIRRVEARK